MTDRMTTGMARTIRKKSNGTHGLVGRTVLPRGAGSASCTSDEPPPADLDAAPAALDAAPDPLEADAAEPAPPAAFEPPEAPAPAARRAPRFEAPGALPMGGKGGGEAPAPRLPLKVGLLQLPGLNC